MQSTIPLLPPALTESRPVVITGTAIWIVITLVAFLAPDALGTLRWVGVCGIGVGLFGAVVLTLQRRALQRGARSAQHGLT